MQVGSFGDVVFEVSADGRVMTPDDVTRERKARYEEHKVLGALPRLEYLSAELVEMEMRIHLRAGLGVNPLREADKLGQIPPAKPGACGVSRSKRLNI